MKFNFDQQIASQEHTPVSDKMLDEAYKKAEKILSAPIDPREFTDYKDVEADIAFVEQQEARHRKIAAQDSPEQARGRKLGKIFEAIIFEHAEQSNWFGENAATTQASRYDDIQNKVDAIVEFSEGHAQASHLALAMDVTVSERFGEKFAHIKETIDRGELTEIKYFVSEILNIHGKKRNIPHVVLGVDRKTLYDVVAKWARGEQRALADHPIQVKLLAGIKVQLQAYAKYAETVGQSHLPPIYEKTLRTIEQIIADKGISANDLRDAMTDEMLYAIKFNAEHLSDRK